MVLRDKAWLLGWLFAVLFWDPFNHLRNNFLIKIDLCKKYEQAAGV
jgi:hypothetical protein